MYCTVLAHLAQGAGRLLYSPCSSSPGSWPCTNQEVSMTAGYVTQIEYSGHETLCDVIKIVCEWTATVDYLLILSVIVYLLYKVYEQFK